MTESILLRRFSLELLHIFRYSAGMFKDNMWNLFSAQMREQKKLSRYTQQLSGMGLTNIAEIFLVEKTSTENVIKSQSE